MEGKIKKGKTTKDTELGDWRRKGYQVFHWRQHPRWSRWKVIQGDYSRLKMLFLKEKMQHAGNTAHEWILQDLLSPVMVSVLVQCSRITDAGNVHTVPIPLRGVRSQRACKIHRTPSHTFASRALSARPSNCVICRPLPDRPLSHSGKLIQSVLELFCSWFRYFGSDLSHIHWTTRKKGHCSGNPSDHLQSWRNRAHYMSGLSGPSFLLVCLSLLRARDVICARCGGGLK